MPGLLFSACGGGPETPQHQTVSSSSSSATRRPPPGSSSTTSSWGHDDVEDVEDDPEKPKTLTQSFSLMWQHYKNRCGQIVQHKDIIEEVRLDINDNVANRGRRFFSPHQQLVIHDNQGGFGPCAAGVTGVGGGVTGGRSCRSICRVFILSSLTVVSLLHDSIEEILTFH